MSSVSRYTYASHTSLHLSWKSNMINMWTATYGRNSTSQSIKVKDNHYVQPLNISAIIKPSYSSYYTRLTAYSTHKTVKTKCVTETPDIIATGQIFSICSNLSASKITSIRPGRTKPYVPQVSVKRVLSLNMNASHGNEQFICVWVQDDTLFP